MYFWKDDFLYKVKLKLKFNIMSAITQDKEFHHENVNAVYVQNPGNVPAVFIQNNNTLTINPGQGHTFGNSNNTDVVDLLYNVKFDSANPWLTPTMPNSVQKLEVTQIDVTECGCIQCNNLKIA